MEHYRFVKALEDDNTRAKQTVPSPAQTLFILMQDIAEDANNPYKDNDALAEAIANAYIQVSHDLYEAGCRTLQFDDCTWGAFVSEDFKDTVFGVDAKTVQRQFAAVNNAVN